MSALTSLADHEKACLVVIDVQQHFIDKLPFTARCPLVARIGWLMAVARVLRVPILTTAEDMADLGPLVAELSSELPPHALPTFDKSAFGLAGQKAIWSAVESSGRRQVVLTGLETDVCVSQSALGLVSRGLDVYVVEDCCSSPGPAHQSGIRRMRDAGVAVLSLKALYYEWVRTTQTHRRVRDALGRGSPPGLVL